MCTVRTAQLAAAAVHCARTAEAAAITLPPQVVAELPGMPQLCVLLLLLCTPVPALHVSSEPAPAQLSRQTREWWRWVLVRLYHSSQFVADGDDAARQAFVDEWRPDLFDWNGDQRWNVGEWARLRGIAVAAGQALEYEEAQFHNHVYVEQTWGVEGGVAIARGGGRAGFASSGLSPFMTHAAPKWHAAVTQG